MITKAMVVHKLGGPEVFSYEDIEVKTPSEGEILIKHHAIGVNFIDTYFRNGTYPWKGTMPIIVGAEGSGEVIELGKGVTDLKIGDRIAYTLPHGGYCQHRVVPANRVVKLPDAISYEVAAASMLKGLTAEYLLHRTFKVQPNQTILIHAAAGGVGLLAGQWASKLGATVIGTVSTAEKAALALKNGYAHVINYKTENFVERVLEITNGKGVEVAYDSVGKDTFPHTLKCIKRLGHWVSFGQSSGLIEGFTVQDLARNGSLTATRPTLFDYITTKEELNNAANRLFTALTNGDLSVSINQRFPLKEAKLVHELMEGRKTVGSTVLSC